MSELQLSRAAIAAPFGSLVLEASDSLLLKIEVRIETSGLSAPSTPLLLEAERQFNAYFEYPRWQFFLPLCLEGTTCQQIVWQRLCTIPPGSVQSYGQLAFELQNGARAVAGACRANRFPIIIPCHRVVAAHGIGGYCGAVTGALPCIKRWLLRHEGYESP